MALSPGMDAKPQPHAAPTAGHRSTSVTARLVIVGAAGAGVGVGVGCGCGPVVLVGVGVGRGRDPSFPFWEPSGGATCLPLPLPLPLPLAIVAIPMAYWLISLSCRFFFLLCLPVGDFPDGNRRCRKRSR